MTRSDEYPARLPGNPEKIRLYAYACGDCKTLGLHERKNPEIFRAGDALMVSANTLTLLQVKGVNPWPERRKA